MNSLAALPNLHRSQTHCWQRHGRLSCHRHGCSHRGNRCCNRWRCELVSGQLLIEERDQFGQAVQVFHQTAEAQFQTKNAFKLQRGLSHGQRVQTHVNKGRVTMDGVSGQPGYITDDADDFFLQARNAAHDLYGLRQSGFDRSGRHIQGWRSFALEPMAFTHEWVGR